VSPPIHLISQDYDKLRHVLDTSHRAWCLPQMARYGKAIAGTVGADVEVVLTSGQLEGRASTLLTAGHDRHRGGGCCHAGHRPGHHRQVPVHQRLHQAAQGGDQHPAHVVRQPAADAPVMPVLAEDPLVLVDWLPWNHTFGGNHNFGMVVFNGGTLYIDDGKPTPALMARRCATCARSRPPCTSTCPRALRRSPTP
jgi:feruloyl-CoA synthase